MNRKKERQLVWPIKQMVLAWEPKTYPLGPLILRRWRKIGKIFLFWLHHWPNWAVIWVSILKQSFLLSKTELQSESHKILNCITTNYIFFIAGFISPSPGALRLKLEELWFTPYSRSPKYNMTDTSGFEHVFCGELKTTTASGEWWVQYAFIMLHAFLSVRKKHVFSSHQDIIYKFMIVGGVDH